jgi:hypothetical protein
VKDKEEEKSWVDSAGEVLKLKTPAQGKKYVAAELKRLRSTRKDWKKMTFKQAKTLWLSNMGYMTGYYGPKQANHIMRVLDTAHPFFGRKR